MILVNLNYIRELYDFLFAMSDKEICEININDKKERLKIFNEFEKTFQKFGPVSKNATLLAMNYLILTNSSVAYWRKVVPHDLPLDDVIYKEQYLIDMYQAISGGLPDYFIDTKSVVLVDEIGPAGLNIRE